MVLLPIPGFVAGDEDRPEAPGSGGGPAVRGGGTAGTGSRVRGRGLILIASQPQRTPESGEEPDNLAP
jgi:hypothetical protein